MSILRVPINDLLLNIDNWRIQLVFLGSPRSPDGSYPPGLDTFDQPI